MNNLKAIATSADSRYFTITAQKIGLTEHIHVKQVKRAGVFGYVKLKEALTEAASSHITGYYGKHVEGYDRFYNCYEGNTFVHLYAYKEEAGA